MGSGLLAAAVVLVVMGFRLLRRETDFRTAWPALAVSAALVAAGALTRVEVSYHDHMKAKTLHDFFFSLVHSLQWPVPSGYDWLAALLWLPWLLAALSVLRGRADFSPPSASSSTSSVTGQIIVALGGWVLVQLLATAYARGAGAGFPASRYMDTLTFGAMVNALCLAWLVASAAATTTTLRSTLPRLGFALLWCAPLAFGLNDLVRLNYYEEMPSARRYYDKAEAHLRGYLATDDPAQLEFPDIPYPSAGGLIDRLDHPCMRELMPAIVRAPLPLVPAPASTATASPFLANQASQLTHLTAPHHGISPKTFPLASVTTWGSFAASDGPAATGEWQSAPLTAPLGAWLKFETAGQLGASPATLSLELRDAQSGTTLASIRPSKIPGDTWRSAYVRAPSSPFVVVARDQDPARWLAFGAPVEMGHFSYLASRATKHGLLLAEIAALIAAGTAATALCMARISPRAPRTPAPPAPATA
jgi:hypothetical protein